MTPLAGHTVFHPRFDAYHRPAVITSHTVQVEVHRRDADDSNDGAGWDPTGGASAPAADLLVWTGLVRLDPEQSAALMPETAGQEVPVRTYRLAFPVDAPPLRAGDGGDTITILDSPTDAQAKGRVLRVVDITVSTHSFEREVVATDDLSENGPPLGEPA